MLWKFSAFKFLGEEKKLLAEFAAFSLIFSTFTLPQLLLLNFLRFEIESK